MRDPAMGAPSRDRLDTHRRAMRLIATDRAFREQLVTNTSGESRLIVVDWEDSIGEFFNTLHDVGLPSNLVVPLGDDGIWLLSLQESYAHRRFTQPFDLDAPMRDLLMEAMRRGRIAVCPAEATPAAIQLRLFREAS